MIDFSCLVVKANGRLKAIDEPSFRRAWAEVGEGQELELTLSEVAHEPKYTRAQEKFFHGPILKAFMEHCGYRKAEAKAMLCLRFIPQEIKLMDGSIVVVPGSTSALGKKAYGDLIDECMQLAAEEDIYIKDGAEWRAQQQKGQAA